MAIARITEAFRILKGLLTEPAKQTYYEDHKQKCRLQMLVDHIRWFIKCGELNHFYYVYGFDVKSWREQNQYMGKMEFNKIRGRSNNSVWIGNTKTSYICLLRDKFVFSQYMKSLGLPVPEIYGLCDKDTITWIETGLTEPLEMFCKADGHFFVKEILSGCGEGVYPVSVKDGAIFVNDKDVGLDGLRSNIQDTCLIQEKIIQHPVMNQLNNCSVNTVRLVTVMEGEEPRLISGICRVGVQSSHLDNWSAGGIGVGLDIEKGTLKKYGFRIPKYPGRLEKHSDSNVTFEGFEIPFYNKAVEAAIDAHRMFYGIHSIGWDIAISENGPVFIEGNNHWDMPMMQAHDNHLKEKYLAIVPKGLRRL